MAKQMRKVRVGAVVRTRMDKTAVVEMVWKQRHTLYSKQMRRVARFYVHDPDSQCQIGDTVRIEETRPISKTKHWRLLEILQHKQLAEVSPIDLETEITPVMTGEALAEAPSDTEIEVSDAHSDDEDEATEE
tara:strand:- start:459 stop:854 length:396 start_codon:yes stop_codon:yes gene_type:complete